MIRLSHANLAESLRRTTDRFGGVWRHRKTGNLYHVTGAILLCCEGERDGSTLLRYRADLAPEAPEFCRPVGEFLERFDRVEQI